VAGKKDRQRRLARERLQRQQAKRAARAHRSRQVTMIAVVCLLVVGLGVGGFLGVGEKKLGVRLSALRISKADGKIAITFPAATKEMLGAVEAYQRPGGAAPAKK